MNEIESITGKIDGTTLIRLGMNKKLRGFAITCQWEGGEYTTGWSGGTLASELALMSLLLNSEVTEFINSGGEQKDG